MHRALPSRSKHRLLSSGHQGGTSVSHDLADAREDLNRLGSQLVTVSSIAAGLAVAALLVIARTTLVVSDAGDHTWADVGWDVVGLGLAAFGGSAVVSLGRHAGALGRSFTALRTAARSAAAARMAPLPRFILRFSGGQGISGRLIR